MVGTWSLDQTLLWTPGTNATTGEHVDLSDLALVGAQLELIQKVQAAGKPTVVVLVSGKPVAEPWIQASAYINFQYYSLAYLLYKMRTPSSSNSIQENLAVLLLQRLFSETSTHLVRSLIPVVISIVLNLAGKLPVSFPRSVGTAPAFYNYLKGARPLDPGAVYDNGSLSFGHQVCDVVFMFDTLFDSGKSMF